MISFKHLAGAKIETIVFDFDGTLVDSNRLKRRAFYQIFPDGERYQEVINQVLGVMNERPRFHILREILVRLAQDGSEAIEARLSALTEEYNSLVVYGAKTCSEMPGATKALEYLNEKYALYLSSTTPEEPLREIIADRGWLHFFKDVFGYPRQKNETLVEIMSAESVLPAEMLVIGDGESDRRSARSLGSLFFPIDQDHDLNDLIKVL